MQIQTHFSPPRPKIQRDPDFGRDPEDGPDLASSLKTAGLVGWVGLTTAAGAVIGQNHQELDQVTVERIPYAETQQVPVGTHVQQGCYQHHWGWSMMDGEFNYHYGYDSSCRKTVTDYQTQPTGRTLYQEVTHHTQPFPHTPLGGALVGLGVGAVTGVLAAVLGEALVESR